MVFLLHYLPPGGVSLRRFWLTWVRWKGEEAGQSPSPSAHCTYRDHRSSPASSDPATIYQGRKRSVDSDLAESVSLLKDIFTRRGIEARFAKAEPALVSELKKTLQLPPRYRAFL